MNLFKKIIHIHTSKHYTKPNRLIPLVVLFKSFTLNTPRIRKLFHIKKIFLKFFSITLSTGKKRFYNKCWGQA